MDLRTLVVISMMCLVVACARPQGEGAARGADR